MVFFELFGKRMEHFSNQNPRDQEREFSPYANPRQEKKTSDSVELGETDVCFMHIQLIGTNV